MPISWFFTPFMCEMYANGNTVPLWDGVSVLIFLRKNVEYLLQFLHASFTTFPSNCGILTITEEQPLYQRYAGIFFLLPPFICETYVSKTVVPPGRLFYFALFPIPTKYAILKRDYSFPEDGKMPLIFTLLLNVEQSVNGEKDRLPSLVKIRAISLLLITWLQNVKI